jgi:type IV pilus assembly protein PilZ
MSKHGILSLTINKKAALHAAYMPFINSGALFIPTTRCYQLADELFLLIKLLDCVEIIPVAGKVIWITPTRAQGRRVAGVGVQFIDPSESLKKRIEHFLLGKLDRDKSTHTL